MISFRKIPHPKYGNWGGRKNTHDHNTGPLPIDNMDWAFSIHDYILYNKLNGRYADYLLTRMLKIVKVKGCYARLYRRMALIIFSITGKKEK